jgi:hypothetical protein
VKTVNSLLTVQLASPRIEALAGSEVVGRAMERRDSIVPAEFGARLAQLDAVRLDGGPGAIGRMAGTVPSAVWKPARTSRRSNGKQRKEPARFRVDGRVPST